MNLRSIHILFFFLLMSSALMAQSFRASTSARSVVEGTTFNVKFTLEDARGKQFQPPSFRGFRVISGPNTSNSTTIVNGNMSSSQSMSYTLLPTAKGTFTIGSASIQAKGKTMKSNAIRIEVVEKKEGTTDGKDVFVEAKLSSDTAFVGQQVILEMILYTQVNVERADILIQPEFEDIFVADIPRTDRSTQQEVVNGNQYTTQVFRRWALYPQKSGKYDLGSFLVRLGIPEDGGGGRRSSFFFTTRLETKEVQTNELKFDIIPLPEPKPVSFSGGIGTYSAKMKSDRTRLSTDDALSLVVTITGDGDERMLAAPDLNLGEDFEMYDANELGTKPKQTQNKLVFNKSFEYLIVPKKAGRQWLKPKFTYFQPDSNRYVTLVIDSIMLDVSKGTSESKALKKFKADQELDLGPLLTDNEVITTSKPWTQQWPFLGIWAILGCGFLGLLWAKKQKDADDNLDPKTKKFLRARKQAEKRLTVAKSLINDTTNSKFYEELALGIKQYLGDKLDIEPSKLTKQVIAEELKKLGAEDTFIERVTTLMSNCDMALFAPGMTPDRESMYEDGVGVVVAFDSAQAPS